MIKPLTNTTKAPYNPTRSYCNDMVGVAPACDNIPCYNHDCRYSDPQGKSRAQCDWLYFKDMRAAGAGLFKAWGRYLAVRAGGGLSWSACRANDVRTGSK